MKKLVPLSGVLAVAAIIGAFIASVVVRRVAAGDDASLQTIVVSLMLAMRADTAWLEARRMTPAGAGQLNCRFSVPVSAAIPGHRDALIRACHV
ncbi:MAG: hypothetical protein FJW90_03430 [Actinobacteria bacterium]|nr:hypothetical protein [Actinomycetota bacterium]